MRARLAAVAALAALFLIAPAALAPLFIALGPLVLVVFAAGCLTVAAVI
jgi:hypothetical protein